jgi:REP element-mobilizing transposase RayT
MVIGYHLIWTAYGAWLPNDPRGSGSRVVVSRKLSPLGEVHFGRKGVQPRRAEVADFHARAESLLAHLVIRFDAQQLSTVADSLGRVIREAPYTCWACAVMPDHVHVVIRKHRHRAEEMIERLQDAAREGLIRHELMPEGHPVWTVGGWKVFLDSPEAVRSRIAYVERNPTRDGMPPQDWSFVTVYDGWPEKRGGLNRKR